MGLPRLLNPRDNVYLSPAALQNLKYYKYGAVDKSPLSKYVLQPYWTWCVQFFPLWMAPNLITLIGLGFVVFHVVLIWFLMPDLVGPTYSWVYFSSALGIWLYSTFDNVDGKQARRTNSSSPLGELFDHGCDALNCSLGGIVQVAAMGLGKTWFAAFVPFIAIVAFYMSTWEEYYTGVLYLGYVNGPTEGLVLACSLTVLSGIFGPQIYQLPVGPLLPAWLAPLVPSSWLVVDLIAAGMVFSLAVLHIPFCLLSVYKTCQRQKKDYTTALWQLTPLIVYCTSTAVWLGAAGSTIMAEHMIVFTLTVGIVFGRIATKIILAYVTKMPFPMFTVMQVPLVLGAVLANWNLLFGKPFFTPRTEALYLYACFSFVIVAYMHWALMVIEKFCAHLNIKCLSIPYNAASSSTYSPVNTTVSPTSSSGKKTKYQMI